jgi:hypothetical protein
VTGGRVRYLALNSELVGDIVHALPFQQGGFPS